MMDYINKNFEMIKNIKRDKLINILYNNQDKIDFIYDELNKENNDYLIQLDNIFKKLNNIQYFRFEEFDCDQEHDYTIINFYVYTNSIIDLIINRKGYINSCNINSERCSINLINDYDDFIEEIENDIDKSDYYELAIYNTDNIEFEFDIRSTSSREIKSELNLLFEILYDIGYLLNQNNLVTLNKVDILSKYIKDDDETILWNPYFSIENELELFNIYSKQFNDKLTKFKENIK